MHILRSQFADMKPDEAMSFLLNQMRKTKNNDELLVCDELVDQLFLIK